MRKEDKFLEELFCETYGTETFEEAVEEFEEEEEFKGTDGEFDSWLKSKKGDDELLCWLWDYDCGASGPDGFCDEVRERFGKVTLKTVKLHAEDTRVHLTGERE